MVKTRSLYHGLGIPPGRDRRTDRQTDRIPIANTRSQQYLPVQLSRVKKTQFRLGQYVAIFSSCVRAFDWYRNERPLIEWKLLTQCTVVVGLFHKTCIFRKSETIQKFERR